MADTYLARRVPELVSFKPWAVLRTGAAPAETRLKTTGDYFKVCGGGGVEVVGRLRWTLELDASCRPRGLYLPVRAPCRQVAHGRRRPLATGQGRMLWLPMPWPMCLCWTAGPACWLWIWRSGIAQNIKAHGLLRGTGGCTE